MPTWPTWGHCCPVCASGACTSPTEAGTVAGRPTRVPCPRPPVRPAVPPPLAPLPLDGRLVPNAGAEAPAEAKLSLDATTGDAGGLLTPNAPAPNTLEVLAAIALSAKPAMGIPVLIEEAATLEVIIPAAELITGALGVRTSAAPVAPEVVDAADVDAAVPSTVDLAVSTPAALECTIAPEVLDAVTPNITAAPVAGALETCTPAALKAVVAPEDIEDGAPEIAAGDEVPKLCAKPKPCHPAVDAGETVNSVRLKSRDPERVPSPNAIPGASADPYKRGSLYDMPSGDCGTNTSAFPTPLP